MILDKKFANYHDHHITLVDIKTAIGFIFIVVYQLSSDSLNTFVQHSKAYICFWPLATYVYWVIPVIAESAWKNLLILTKLIPK